MNKRDEKATHFLFFLRKENYVDLRNCRKDIRVVLQEDII